MKEKIINRLTEFPLFLGILSIITLTIYYYSAHHAPYSYTGIIIFTPLLSLSGMITSFISIKLRNNHPYLWISGAILCTTLTILYLLFFLLLIYALKK